MRRLGLAAFAGVVLVGVGVWLVSVSSVDGVYSIRQLDREIHLHPQVVIGQSFLVRAVPMTYGWGSGHGIVAGDQDFLIEPPFSNSFFTTVYSARATVYGARATLLNVAGVASSVLIVGPRPQPSGGKRALNALARLPVIGRFFGTEPDLTPAIYRIRIVRAGPCPPLFGGFCPSARYVS